MQELITTEQREQLIANGRDSAARIVTDGNTQDHKPVVKLFAQTQRGSIQGTQVRSRLFRRGTGPTTGGPQKPPERM